MDNDCFPEWMKRRASRTMGPPIDELIPTPIYQRQELVLSPYNENSPSENLSDAYFKSFASRILTANLNQTIVKITPRDAYDTIIINAWDNGVSAAASRGTTIFFSVNRPGRIITEPMNAGNPEASLCTANFFNIADPSSFPTCMATPISFFIGTANGIISTNLVFKSPKTNRPFYFWFSDGGTVGAPAAAGTVGLPTIAANFKVTWVVLGR